MEYDPNGAPVGGGRQGGQATEQAKQQGQQLARQARQQASDLANRGGEQVKTQLANQKHEAAQRMTPIQTALRETGQQLRKQGQGPVAQYADRAADQVERFSGYLRETEVDEMVDEVRGFARRRPAIFLGGAAALGFLATRFLKSSSQAASSSGYDPGSTPSATSRAAVAHGRAEPVTALPPGPVVDESPAARRTTTAESPIGDPSEPPRGF